MEHREAVLYVQMGYVVANMDGVAPHLITVEMVAKASALPVVVVAMSAASSARLFLTKCLNIQTIDTVKVMDSTLTMLSSLLPDLSMALAQLVMLLHGKGRSLLSWLKPLLRPQVSFTTIQVLKAFMFIEREKQSVQ